MAEHRSLDYVQRQLAPTLTNLVIEHLRARSPEEQAWLKEKIEQIEWDFRNRNFGLPSALKAIDF